MLPHCQHFVTCNKLHGRNREVKEQEQKNNGDRQRPFSGKQQDRRRSTKETIP